MDVEKFVRHLCRLVLRHQMPVWNYFVNSFYSEPFRATPQPGFLRSISRFLLSSAIKILVLLCVQSFLVMMMQGQAHQGDVMLSFVAS